jgi:hypothetical protein
MSKCKWFKIQQLLLNETQNLYSQNSKGNKRLDDLMLITDCLAEF